MIEQNQLSAEADRLGPVEGPATPSPRKTRFLVTPIIAACLFVASCASPPSAPYGSKESPHPFIIPSLSMQDAQRNLQPGQTTKAEVAAMLGGATVVTFNSGYEVWVYRAKAAGSNGRTNEFVVLFTQNGVVRKVRLRSG